jgi:hypothetical protein
MAIEDTAFINMTELTEMDIKNNVVNITTMNTDEPHIDFSSSIMSFRIPHLNAREGAPRPLPQFSPGGEILNFLSNISAATEGATIEELLDVSDNIMWSAVSDEHTYAETSESSSSRSAFYPGPQGFTSVIGDASSGIPSALRNLLGSFGEGPHINSILNRSLHDAAGYKFVLSDEGVASLEDKKYSTEECGNDSCPITRAAFEEGDEVTELPCGHCFNPDAIIRWLKDEKAECPVCRYALKSKEVKNEYAQSADSEETEIRNARIALLNSLARTRNAVHPFGPRLPPIVHRHASMMVSSEDNTELQEAIMRSLITR